MMTADRITAGYAEVYKKHTPLLAEAIASAKTDMELLDVVITETITIREELRKLGSIKHLKPSKRVAMMYLKEKDLYTAAMAKVSRVLDEASRILNNLN
jgi:hypothetical protein